MHTDNNTTPAGDASDATSGQTAAEGAAIAVTQASNPMQPIRGQGRGFLSLTPERRREIASAGGKAAHAKGTGHQFTPDEARAAGAKGGAMRSARIQQRKAEQVNPATPDATS